MDIYFVIIHLLKIFLWNILAQNVFCLFLFGLFWFYVRDIVSIILGGYFIIFSKKAEDRMHRFHQNATIEGVRACWNKARHPILWRITQMKQPLKIAIHRRKLTTIKRQSDNSLIDCYLYFQGTEESLKKARHVVINYPGGYEMSWFCLLSLLFLIAMNLQNRVRIILFYFLFGLSLVCK